MRRGTIGRALAGVCLAGLLAPAAEAAIVYEFVTGQTTYNLLPSATTTIPIFLRETISGSDTSKLAAEGSLFSGVVQLTRETSPSDPVTITRAARDPTYNGFNDTAITGGGSGARLGGSRSLDETDGAPLTVDPNNPNVRFVRIGEIDLRAGAIPLQQTVFTLGDIPGRSDTVTNMGNTLDSQITNTTITIDVVPEPASAGLLGLAAIGLLARRRRACR